MANRIEINPVSDTPFDATSWSGVTSIAPSKDAIRDKLVALDASIAATYVPHGGNRLVAIGDSLTDWNSPTAGTWAINFVQEATLLAGGRLQWVANKGVGGNTTAQMLARFDADVTPNDPSIVVVEGGINDSAGSVTVATFAANITAIHAKCVAIGALCVLTTVTPQSESARKPFVSNYNTWLRRYAADSGLPLIDFHDALADVATGDLDAAYDNGDGIHPNTAGHKVMASTLATDLTSWLTNSLPLLPTSNIESGNLVTNGLFLGTLTSKVPTSWTASPAVPSTVTATLETDAAIKGQWLKLVTANLSGFQLYMRSCTVTPGNRYAFVGRIKIVSSDGVAVQARMLFNDSNDAGYAIAPISARTHTLTDGVFYVEAVAPGNATTANVRLQLTGSGNGNSEAWFAQIGIYDLTAAGVAA